MIATRERQLYEDVWQGLDRYGDLSPGVERLPMFLEMVGATLGGIAPNCGSVLDAGCGSGKAALALEDAGFSVTCADLTDAGLVNSARVLPFVGGPLWATCPLGAFDWVYCCDVLEHVPTEFTMLTIARLLETARLAVFLSIALVPDQFGAWVGQPLHQTVQPFTWWRDRLKELGELVECRDLIDAGVYLVRPR